MEKQKLLFHQARLSNRGVAEMVLLHISASKGIPSEMVMTTLNLGIAILRGGNIDIQMGMLNHLKEKKDVGFFTSIAGLMNSCSVLDLDAFERNTKAEGKSIRTRIPPTLLPLSVAALPRSITLLICVSTSFQLISQPDHLACQPSRQPENQSRERDSRYRCTNPPIHPKIATRTKSIFRVRVQVLV